MTCSYCEKSEQEVAQLLKAPGVALCNECIERGMTAIVSEKPVPLHSGGDLASTVCAMCSRRVDQVTRILLIHGRPLCSSCLFSSFDIVLSHRDSEGKIIRVD